MVFSLKKKVGAVMSKKGQLKAEITPNIKLVKQRCKKKALLTSCIALLHLMVRLPCTLKEKKCSFKIFEKIKKY